MRRVTAMPSLRATTSGVAWPAMPIGSAATLADVVAHYNRVRKLGFTPEQERDLVEYLKSL